MSSIGPGLGRAMGNYMPNGQQPVFVEPGFRFVYDEASDTVETHMLIKSSDGSQSWEITHKTTASIFLQGEAEYRRCVEAIRGHRRRGVVTKLPRVKRAKG